MNTTEMQYKADTGNIPMISITATFRLKYIKESYFKLWDWKLANRFFNKRNGQMELYEPAYVKWLEEKVTKEDDLQVQAWNEAIEAAIENAAPEFKNGHIVGIDKQSIQKLKK